MKCTPMSFWADNSQPNIITTAPVRTRWEYIAVSLSSGGEYEWIKQFEDLGREGWEYATTHDGMKIFKRPV